MYMKRLSTPCTSLPMRAGRYGALWSRVTIVTDLETADSGESGHGSPATPPTVRIMLCSMFETPRY